MDRVLSETMRTATVAIVTVFVLVTSSAVNAQEFQYQFRDTPTADADVVVVRHTLTQGPGADFYITGRVFNRGVKPARNVRVVYTVTNKHGAKYPTGPVYLNPSDIPPRSFADFEARVPLSIDPRDVFVQAHAEWNKE
jgi:hypothetical protein